MTGGFGQAAYDLRFEWGPAGGAAVAAGAAVVVVVDLLSFTTTLSLAVERGISVLPFPWHDRSAAASAAARSGATLAAGRLAAGPGEISLSPRTLLDPPAGVRRLVLPSPNGSAVSAALDGAGPIVVGACLRNVRAAAAWVRRAAAGRPVAVVAAGERWPDGSLRPAVEDLWAAGAFLDVYLAGPPVSPSVPSLVAPSVSPEAAVARDAYRSVADRLARVVSACASGLELAESGFGGDVALALEWAVSDAVPVLRAGWFVDGGFRSAGDL